MTEGKNEQFKRFYIDKHDVGHYVIRDRVEQCGWPAGRELPKLETLVDELNQLVPEEQECVDFRVSDGKLHISYDARCDGVTHDWKKIVDQCH